MIDAGTIGNPVTIRLTDRELFELGAVEARRLEALVVEAAHQHNVTIWRDDSPVTFDVVLRRTFGVPCITSVEAATR